MSRQPILFVAENVTLAQVVRLVQLARHLPADEFEVHFASAEFPDLVFAGTGFEQHRLTTLSPVRAQKALDSGRRLYGEKELTKYVAAELVLFERVRPRLVVGDFRLSLSTSAELAAVPSAVLINAYWSPFAHREVWPVPDHPVVRLLGERLTARYFPKAIPWVFEHFAAPLNAVRKAHGLQPVGSLLEMLSHATYTLYPDDPRLTPVHDAPPTHRFLGPVSWEPEAPTPQLDFEDPGRPLVYVTLGSSGRLDVLPIVLQALGSLPVNGLVATARRIQVDSPPEHVRVVEFVPGSHVAGLASVVVSNGGSTTGYQALAEGTPVVGLPSNFDQYLAMQAIERAGAGISIKARQATAENVRAAIERALDEASMKTAARQIAERFAQLHSGARFHDVVREACARGR